MTLPKQEEPVAFMDIEDRERPILAASLAELRKYPESKFYADRFQIPLYTRPSLDARMREALENVKAAILEAPIDIVTCTLWMPPRLSPNETVVDYIDAALSSPVQSKDPT